MSIATNFSISGSFSFAILISRRLDFSVGQIDYTT